LTLTFDRAIRHIVLHQSSTSTYIPNFIQIQETFCGRTDVRTDISPLYIIRSTLGSRPNKSKRNTLGFSEQTDLMTVSISSLVNMHCYLSSLSITISFITPTSACKLVDTFDRYVSRILHPV